MPDESFVEYPQFDAVVTPAQRQVLYMLGPGWTCEAIKFLCFPPRFHLTRYYDAVKGIQIEVYTSVGAKLQFLPGARVQSNWMNP